MLYSPVESAVKAILEKNEELKSKIVLMTTPKAAESLSPLAMCLSGALRSVRVYKLTVVIMVVVDRWPSPVCRVVCRND